MKGRWRRGGEEEEEKGGRYTVGKVSPRERELSGLSHGESCSYYGPLCPSVTGRESGPNSLAVSDIISRRHESANHRNSKRSRPDHREDRPAAPLQQNFRHREKENTKKKCWWQFMGFLEK